MEMLNLAIIQYLPWNRDTLMSMFSTEISVHCDNSYANLHKITEGTSVTNNRRGKRYHGNN